MVICPGRLMPWKTTPLGSEAEESFFKPIEPLIAPPPDLENDPSNQDMAWAELAAGLQYQGENPLYSGGEEV